jgi:hypothetical protein
MNTRWARRVRSKPHPHISRRDGGHTIDLRDLALAGIHLHGRLLGAGAGTAQFKSDLSRRLRRADMACEKFMEEVDEKIEELGLDAPPDDTPRHDWDHTTTRQRSTSTPPECEPSSGQPDTTTTTRGSTYRSSTTRATRDTSAASRKPMGSTSSAFTGSIPGDPASSTEWARTLSSWPTTSRRGAENSRNRAPES